MTLGERIKSLRKAKNFSQKSLGEAMGIDRLSIWRWENGKNEPVGSNLHALASALGVSVDYLLSGGENDNSEFVRVSACEALIRNSELKTKDKDEKPAATPAARPADLPPSNVRMAEEFIMVPMVSSDVRVCCGAGNAYPEEVTWETVGVHPVPARALSGHMGNLGDGGVRVIRAEGDSMEPKIYDGDNVLIADNDTDKISDGDICVVYYGGRIYIRGVVSRRNSVTLRALNPAYRDIVITPDDDVEFGILSRVLCRIPKLESVNNIYT